MTRGGPPVAHTGGSLRFHFPAGYGALMADDELSFAEKVRTIGVVGLSSSPKQKRTVDDHGTHNVVVTEHSSKDDRVDVTVTPPTVHRTRS